MNKEQLNDMKSKPEFDVLRKILLSVYNGNMMRMYHTNYFAEETRQVIQKLESSGYTITKKESSNEAIST